MVEFVGSVTISHPVGSHDIGKNCKSVTTRISKSKAVTHV